MNMNKYDVTVAGCKTKGGKLIVTVPTFHNGKVASDYVSRMAIFGLASTGRGSLEKMRVESVVKVESENAK